MLLALLASPAAADVPDDIPGTGGDPLVALTLEPQYVDAPLYPGLAVRGLEPADTRVLFDGFEVPSVFHDGRALRSVFVPDGLGIMFERGTGVGYGRGTSFVAFTPRDPPSHGVVQLTDLDLTAAVPVGGSRHTLLATRGAWPVEVGEESSFDSMFYAEKADGPWRYSFSSIASQDRGEVNGHAWIRSVARMAYVKRPWSITASASPLWGCGNGTCRDSYDAKVSVEHTAAAAGLERLKWGTGIDSINSRFDAGSVFWRSELGGWGYAEATLTPHIVARGGLRIDAFHDLRDVATQPRGSIEAKNETTSVILQAGAYRRPPEQDDELTVGFLHPERTTQVVATLQDHRLLAGHTALFGQITGFYIDRLRLVARDASGNWGNTGFGTSDGIEVTTGIVRGPWHFYAGASLSSSRRRDFPRGREHPADFDQPVRIDSLVGYSKKRWRVAVRFSLSSGLPYTPVVETTYDADADSYTPVYGFANSARLPWSHSLDLRADFRIGRYLAAFAELRNAYAASTALGYQYSYDYKQRLDVTLPILPFVGLRLDIPMRPRRTRPTPVIAEASP